MLLVKRTVRQLDYRLPDCAFRPIFSNVGYGLHIVCRSVRPIALYVSRESVTLDIPKSIAQFMFFYTDGRMHLGGRPSRIVLRIPGNATRIRGTLANGLVSCTIVGPTRKQLLFLARLIVAVLAPSFGA